MRYLEFPAAEMARRMDNAQVLLGQSDLQGLLITAEANYYYFTGYRPHTSWSTFTRPAYLFISKEHAPVLLVQVFAFPEAQSRSAVADVRYFDDVTGSPTSVVVDTLNELGMAQGVVGCELGYEQRLGVSYESFEDLKSQCPGVRFVDAAEILWKLRMVKLPSEIAYMREANQITSRAIEACFDEAHEGMSEREISRRMMELMLKMGATAPGFVIICSGPSNYARTSARATDRSLRRGDMLWLDVGVEHHGYWTDFCRAGVVGGPSAEQQRLQTIVHEATMDACRSIGPGVPVAEVAKECMAGLEKRGMPASFECGRLGHGIGLMSTEPPSVILADSTVLEPGMVINVEPGLVVESGVFVVEEDVLVTEAGYEVMSGASRALHDIALA